MASPLPSHRPEPKGKQLAVGSIELPRDSSRSSMGSPPPAEKRSTFGMLAPLSPEFEAGDFRTGASLSSESEDGSKRKYDFGMRDTPSPSPEREYDFGMCNTPSPSPERKYDFGMRNTPSPLPERKYDFGMHDTPSPEPKQKQDSGKRTPLFLPSPESSPESIQKSDFGLRNSLSPEPQLQENVTAPPPLSPEPRGFGIHQPKGDKEPLGSSSKTRTWKWGEPAPPSPTSGEQKGQPSTIGHALESDDDDDPHPSASILRDHAALLRDVHGYISGVYHSEKRLSGAIDAMSDDLEDAEVKGMM